MNDLPEDKALREQAEREAAEFGDAIAETYAEELKSLVTTYADRDALRIFWRLRDQFWAVDLPKAVKRGKRTRNRR